MSQYATSLFCHRGTIWSWGPPDRFSWSSSLTSWPVPLCGYIQLQVQDFIVPFFELHNVSARSFPHAVQDHQNSSPGLQCINHPDHQFGAIYKLVERVLHSIILVKNKSVNTIDSWDTSLVTKHQLDFAPLFSILWAWQFRQFSTHFIHLCRCHQFGYICILWEIVL